MAARLPAWARTPLVADPHAAVAHNLAHREDNFLHLARTAVFANPHTPYHAMFQWAGCSFGDLERLVRREGLDASLHSLLREGIYLTHDEFKGKVPVRRGGRELQTEATALANLTHEPVLLNTSSGSRGQAVVTGVSLEFQAYREAQGRVLMAEFDAEGRHLVFLANILPAIGGIRRVVDGARRREPAGKWFAVGGDWRSAGHYRFVTGFLLAELRLLGYPVVFPEYLPHNDFSPVARWIAERKRQGVATLVHTGVSRGVRIVSAAAARKLDIAGTRFLVGGEALTDTKRALIVAAGCHANARYTISEFGRAGLSCPHMTGNCVHVCRDQIAVITRRRVAPLSDVEVDSLLFTTLLPFAPHVAINLEMDDAGILGPATCGCPLTQLGFNQQIDRIYSYGKLTGQGTTLLSADLLNILEQKLPARFGGLPGDYQLVEREGTNQTEIELRVHPRLNAAPGDEIKRYFLDEIKGLWAGSMARWVWVQTESVRVVFAEPHASGSRGKVHPLHLLGTWNS